MHVCPMVTVLVPHVGGPILPPCEPTVLIGFLPAARVTDMATCVGPPDSIMMGSIGVMIGNLPAARLGDPTMHGGTIILGEPTVMIGEMGAPSPGAAGAAGVAAGLAASGADKPIDANASKMSAQGTMAAVTGNPLPPVYTPPKTALVEADGDPGPTPAEGESPYEFLIKQAMTSDVSTAENCATFYSGPGNRAKAEAFALENGKTTLEQTPGGKWMDDQKLFEREIPGLSLAHKMRIWQTLSKRYADAASGTCIGFVENARPNSIFNSVEYQALTRNPKVTNVITGGH